MRLHGFPRGLLSLLGAQSFGTAPNELAEAIVPVVDLTRFYLASKLNNFSLNGNVAAGINPTVVEVPTGELWLLQAATFRVVTGAGVTCAEFGMTMGFGPGSAGYVSARGTAAASQQNWVTHSFPGMICPPGSTFGYYSGALVGVPQFFYDFSVFRLTGA